MEMNERLSKVEGKLDRLMSDIYGNGKVGLKRELEDHLRDNSNWQSRWEQREEDKKLYDDRAEKRQKLVIAILGLLLALVTAIVAVETYERTSHSRINLGDTQVYDASSNIK